MQLIKLLKKQIKASKPLSLIFRTHINAMNSLNPVNYASLKSSMTLLISLVDTVFTKAVSINPKNKPISVPCKGVKIHSGVIFTLHLLSTTSSNSTLKLLISTKLNPSN